MTHVATASSAPAGLVVLLLALFLGLAAFLGLALWPRSSDSEGGGRDPSHGAPTVPIEGIRWGAFFTALAGPVLFEAGHGALAGGAMALMALSILGLVVLRSRGRGAPPASTVCGDGAP